MSLTSVRGEQFMSRSGSFSTVGSRRGFSDLGDDIGAESLNNPLEERAVAARHLKALIENKNKTPDEVQRQLDLQALMIELKPRIAEFHLKREELRGMQFGNILKTVCSEMLPGDLYLKIVSEAGKRADEAIGKKL